MTHRHNPDRSAALTWATLLLDPGRTTTFVLFGIPAVLLADDPAVNALVLAVALVPSLQR